MTVAHELPEAWRDHPLWPDLTWEEYLRLEEPPGFVFEFDRGRLMVSPTGKSQHSAVVAYVTYLLMEYEQHDDASPCAVLVEQSFFMPPGQRDLRPDVAVVTDERLQNLERDNYVHGSPDIVVEVLSPRTAARDRQLKAAIYYEQGGQELWLLDPAAEQAEFYRRGPEGWERISTPEDVYETPLLPGFSFDVRALWSHLRRKFPG